jgi:TfoX/Sxy family transcriptional regulator of competence genes
MAFDEKLSNRIRKVLADLPDVSEKYMFGGVCYMVNGKMCIGVVKDKLMCRVGPDVYEAVLENNGCSEMVFTGKPMRGYVYVDTEVIKTRKNLEYWVGLCLEYNKIAKASKKKKLK